MDHKLATDSMAVERYLLGELTPDERTQFEHHAFTCDECADAIQNGIVFLDSGRALVKRQLIFRWERVMKWLPHAAAAALAVVVGVQNFITIPGLRTAAQEPLMQIAPIYNADTSRGAAGEPVRAAKRFMQLINIPSEPAYPGYRCELRDAKGQVRAVLPITALQAKELVPVLLGPLPAGSYVLVVLGVREEGNRAETIDTIPVNVQGP
jgi:Putative zinc-finger